MFLFYFNTLKWVHVLLVDMKYLFIEFPNGDVFKVPAEVVAEDRAAYYAELDSERYEDTTYEEVFKDEKEHGLSDRLELLDWAGNNMNWEDLKDDAERVEPDRSISYEEEFTNADLSVGSQFQP